MERIIEFDAAYDKRDSDPSRNHGVHGVQLRFVLKGTDGAVQFVLSTNWHLPHVTDETDEKILHKASQGVCQIPRFTKIRTKGFDLCEVERLLERASRSVGLVHRSGLDQIDLEVSYHPLPYDLGYHSPRPMHDEHEPITDSCKYLDGRSCYYGGSGLAAGGVYETLLREGSDGVWRKLDEYYAETFRATKSPELC